MKNDILDIICREKSVKQIARCIEKGESFQVNGVTEPLKAAIFAAPFQKSMLVVVPNLHSLNIWQQDLRLLLPDTQIKILPELDFFEVDAAVKSLDLYAERMKILYSLILNQKAIVISTAGAIINPVAPPKIFKEAQIKIKIDDTFSRDELVKMLVEYGYQRDSEVDSIGHFAVRGGIIDVFSINLSSPVRIEFFDNLVESIRTFDINSKRSTQNLDNVLFLPVELNVNKSASIIDYLNEGIVIFDEPEQIAGEVDKLVEENSGANIISFDALMNASKNKSTVLISPVMTDFADYKLSINVNSSVFLRNDRIQRWIGTKHKQNRLTKRKTALDFFNDISVGDYVVHINHGIGKFMGVVSMEVDGSTRDYVHIQYNGDDKIFLPTDQLDAIHKYIAVGDTIPRLSRLNTADWTRAKSRTKAAVEDIAERLIDIYARRGYSEGFAFAPDDALQVEFEDACEFELTEDQARTLEEVKTDMESPKPMDRLVCGDVGFGKTEIAIRAAFKAAMNNKQVAVLVPTTVLAYQHYLTFTKRFKNFLPSVDLLSRFRSPAEQSDTLKRLKSGNLDILIGTHAILNSNKVAFKDLGLLIIDEEQRFGVKQKDKFRDLASGVDVLSLSATPIPRSLHMSMVGARDLSVIETAPAERFPVQTYVVEADDVVIKNAIDRELKRHGQIFFVYNRIETIDIMRERLQNLVPEAKIITAHGQMNSELLEQIMMDFYNGAFDILLTTTIIENGLDIANANTLIVYNADYFGLSQLYQLRGRVGRSSRLAFAYFMFNRDKILSEAASKRLQAMKDFAQLGSSFDIAFRDLQIRGAGNLLGAQQHGHIAGVGFAMYSQLLQEAINKIRKNEQVKVAPSTDDNFQTTLSFKVDCFFDDEYIPNADTKFLFYQRLASLTKVEDIEDFAVELKDRFGSLPQSAQNLVNTAIIKSYAKKIRISAISENEGNVFFQFAIDSKLKPDALKELVKQFKQQVSILSRQRTIKLKFKSKTNDEMLPIVISVLKLLL